MDEQVLDRLAHEVRPGEPNDRLMKSDVRVRILFNVFRRRVVAEIVEHVAQLAQWGAVAISAVSFLLWVPVLDGASAASGIPGSFGIFHALVDDWKILHWPIEVQRFVPELLLVLWTILVPAFYRPSS